MSSCETSNFTGYIEIKNKDLIRLLHGYDDDIYLATDYLIDLTQMFNFW